MRSNQHFKWLKIYFKFDYKDWLCKSSLNSSFKSIIAVAWWVWCNVWNIESDNQVHGRCLSMPIMTERADDWTSCCFNDVSVWALEALTTSWFMRTIVEFQDVTFLP